MAKSLIQYTKPLPDINSLHDKLTQPRLNLQKSSLSYKMNGSGLTITLVGEAWHPWIADVLSETDPWLSLQIGKAQCLQMLQDTQLCCYIAMLAEIPVGAMMIHPRGLAGAAYLKSIAVVEDFRGKGIGAALLRYAEAQYAPVSKKLFLCVSDFNIRAQAFYIEQGYEKIAILKDHIVKGKDEWLMFKQLK